MKKFLWIFSSTLLLSLAFLSTGCGDDTTDPGDLSPVVTITDGPTPASVVAGAGDVVTVTVEATKGTKDLKAIYLYLDGVKVPQDDFTVDGVVVANPFTPPTKDVATVELAITVTADAGVATYSVKVEDDGGLTDEATFDVTVETEIEATITGASINLWNQAGPAGKGAIDLDNGGSTGTNDVTAELRDMGIDSLAGSGDNWRRRIGGINGTEVRYAGNNGSGFDFGAVASKEAIEAIFDEADDLITASTITEDHMSVWGNFKVSDTVAEGDVFVVYKSSTSTYYLVLVNDITETTVLSDNNDKYNVTIKY